MIEDFLHLPPVSTLSCEYLREFSEKFETTLMVNSGAWGKLIHEKNQKSKILWHCPFKCTFYVLHAYGREGEANNEKRKSQEVGYEVGHRDTAWVD